MANLGKTHYLFKHYDEIVNDQIKTRIIERALESHIVGETHHLPHKSVVRDEKAMKKLQIVFDASAKANKSHSSKDCLYPGPSLTATFFGVWLRFWIHNIAFAGDIEKAFLQIGLHQLHRYFVRFLWFQEPGNNDFENFKNNELTELRFCRFLFGLPPARPCYLPQLFITRISIVPLIKNLWINF